MGDLIVIAALVLACTLAVRSLWKGRKRGGCSCGGDCARCGSCRPPEGTKPP